MKNMKALIAMLMIATLAMTACGKQPASVETATTVSSIETPVSVSVSVEEPEPEPELEPEPVYTLQDCFEEGTKVIDSETSFADYINAHKGMIVRAVITKRTYEGVDTVDTDNSEIENIVNQEVYAGLVYDKKADGEKLKARIFSDGDAAKFTDIELEENATLFDVYKGVLKSVNLDTYFESMWMTADTVVDESVMNDVLESKEYRVVSATPADAVFAMMLPDTEYKEIVVGQFDYDLVVTEETIIDDTKEGVSANDVSENEDVSANENTTTLNFAFPSYVDAFLQYVNTEDKTVTYSVNVVYIPVSDLTEIEEKLALVKEEPKPKKEQKAESKPAANKNVTAWGAEVVWEGGVAGQPASVGPYKLNTIYDDGGSNIYIYWSNDFYPNDNSYTFGQLQQQAEAIFMSRGHASAGWHVEPVENHGTKPRNLPEITKWVVVE